MQCTDLTVHKLFSWIGILSMCCDVALFPSIVKMVPKSALDLDSPTTTRQLVPICLDGSVMVVLADLPFPGKESKEDLFPGKRGLKL